MVEETARTDVLHRARNAVAVSARKICKAARSCSQQRRQGAQSVSSVAHKCGRKQLTASCVHCNMLYKTPANTGRSLCIKLDQHCIKLENPCQSYASLLALNIPSVKHVASLPSVLVHCRSVEAAHRHVDGFDSCQPAQVDSQWILVLMIAHVTAYCIQMWTGQQSRVQLCTGVVHTVQTWQIQQLPSHHQSTNVNGPQNTLQESDAPSARCGSRCLRNIKQDSLFFLHLCQRGLQVTFGHAPPAVQLLV
jgi:hypothetical protein